MNGKAVYVDSSAFVKLFVLEPESEALLDFLTPREPRVSSLLLRTEVLRAAMRATLTPRRMHQVYALLDAVQLIPMDVAISDAAGTLHPPELRSLDAIHLATARLLGSDLEALVTYDARLADAATWYGLTVVRPG